MVNTPSFRLSQAILGVALLVLPRDNRYRCTQNRWAEFLLSSPGGGVLNFQISLPFRHYARLHTRTRNCSSRERDALWWLQLIIGPVGYLLASYALVAPSC